MVLFAGLGCVEGGNLAISAGAPVMAAIRGRVTDCGTAVAGAEVVIRVQQDRVDQARPVDTRVGPLTTGRDGSYFAEIGTAFAVPGRASVLVTVRAGGITAKVEGAALHFEIGRPPRDTLRVDADLSADRGFCLGR
jgi:hypothetical protein